MTGQLSSLFGRNSNRTGQLSSVLPKTKQDRPGQLNSDFDETSNRTGQLSSDFARNSNWTGTLNLDFDQTSSRTGQLSWVVLETKTGQETSAEFCWKFKYDMTALLSLAGNSNRQDSSTQLLTKIQTGQDSWTQILIKTQAGQDSSAEFYWKL